MIIIIYYNKNNPDNCNKANNYHKNSMDKRNKKDSLQITEQMFLNFEIFQC